MILVTGGTGLVGSHLLYKLITEGKQVRAIYRQAKTLERVKRVFSYYSKESEALFNAIEWKEANINDIPALEEVFSGIDYVYHCAAFVSFEPDKFDVLRKINIKGTANIVNLCLAFSVKKLCYVSSIAALGENENPQALVTEQATWNPEKDNSVYAITKYGAELEVWRGTQEGLSAVIVNPGIIIGPGYWYGGSSGALFNKIYKGMPYYVDGVNGYVDIWDVINPMYQLMNSEIENEGFILVSENLSFKEFQEQVANHLQVKVAKKRASKLLLAFAWRLDWLQHKLFKKRRKLAKQMAVTAHDITRYSNAKIVEALSYSFKPIDSSIKEVGNLFLEDLKQH